MKTQYLAVQLLFAPADSAQFAEKIVPAPEAQALEKKIFHLVPTAQAQFFRKIVSVPKEQTDFLKKIVFVPTAQAPQKNIFHFVPTTQARFFVKSALCQWHGHNFK